MVSVAVLAGLYALNRSGQWFESSTTEPPQPQKDPLADLFDHAQAALSAGKLDTPANDNAVYYARQLLQSASQRSAARQILQQVIARYVDKGETALSQGQLHEAARYRESAETLSEEFGLDRLTLQSLAEKIQAEIARKAEEIRQSADQRRKADEEQKAAEAKRQAAGLDVRRKAEAEARRQAELKKRKEESARKEAQRLAEEQEKEARRRKESEEQRKREEESRRIAEQEARRKQTEATRQKQEEARRKDAEAKELREEEARRTEETKAKAEAAAEAQARKPERRSQPREEGAAPIMVAP